MKQLSSLVTKSYDVCVVGAGLSGLTAAIKMKQLANSSEKKPDINIIVVDKIQNQLSGKGGGTILDLKVLDEFLPNWKEDKTMPIMTPAAKESLLYLSSPTGSLRIPHRSFYRGHQLISLPTLRSWLQTKAEELGIDILYGQAAMPSYDWENRCSGVNLKGGDTVRARTTLIADGFRGTASTNVIERFRLDRNSEVQHHSLHLSEIWEVPSRSEDKSTYVPPGSILHTRGYPSSSLGSVYHLEGNKIAVGLRLGLDYSNPYFNPSQEFQHWKSHPSVSKLIQGGSFLSSDVSVISSDVSVKDRTSLISSDVSVITVGGAASQPKLVFPGGGLVGGAAHLHNNLSLQSSHLHIKSGLLAGEAAFRLITGAGSKQQGNKAKLPPSNELEEYQGAYSRSWAADEIRGTRNVRPGFRLGTAVGLLHSAFTRWTKGQEPWTLGNDRTQDDQWLKPAVECQPFHYTLPGDEARLKINNPSPSLIQIKDPDLPSRLQGPHFTGFQQHLCPTGVFSYDEDELGRARMKIDADRCLGCGACSIKDPNIKIIY